MRRSIPEPFAQLAAVALTVAILVLCGYIQPGAPVQFWLLFGAAAAASAGALAGARGTVLSAAATVAFVDYFVIPPAGSFSFPRSAMDVIAFIVFAAAAAVIARLSSVRANADAERTRAETASRRLQEEARRRQLLLRLSDRALAGGSLEALCRSAAELTTDALDIRYCAVLEVQPDGRTLAVIASTGWEPGAVEGLTVDASVDSQAGYALIGREPVVVSDADATHPFAVPIELRTRGARSGIAVRIGSVRSVGVVAAYDAAARTFDPADIQFVTNVASTLAGAYERIRLDDERKELVARDGVRREESQLAARRATFLAQTATLLDAALEPETTLVSLARLAVPTLADSALVDLVEEGGQVRRVEVVDIDPIRRQDADALRRLAPDLRSEGPFPRAIRTGQPVLLPELAKVASRSPVDAEHTRLLSRLGCQSLLLIPLVARGQTLGLVTLGSRLPGRYEGADLSLAQELAGRAAIALDNGRLHREAQAASRAKDEFLAMVSHELRTPLNAVLGWSAILRTYRTEDDRSRYALDAIDRSVRAQATLLEQLLDISRIVSGKFELRLAPIMLADVINAAVDTVRPAADDRGIRIEMRLDTDVPPISADADRLQRVVINLLSNAIKFASDKGLVEVEARCVEDTTAEIVVRDFGAGIKPEFLPYVFDRFRQSTTNGAANQGLGLGLAIVREIVERHGGTVMAESAGEGQGATFRVRLPVRSVEPVAIGRDERTAPREPLFKAWNA